MSNFSKLFVMATLVAFVYSCATVPITGRRQLKLVPNSELLPMSFSQYQNIIDSASVVHSGEQAEMIKRVGERIKNAAEELMKEEGSSKVLEGFAWEFHLIDDNIVNAWCMPGGKVAFYTGIMPICQTEAGVAVVMGHEVAHALANHGNERMSQGLVTQFGVGALQVAMGQNPTLTRMLFLQAVGVGSQLGVLKFSRENESESDHIGLFLMAKAGYDPNEAPVFWERMSAAGGGQSPPEFMSTHPSDERRIADLKALMPEAMKYYNP